MMLKFAAFLPVSTWALAVSRAPTAPAGHEYIPPGPDDLRSPCPGINSAANHGFIPRSGKNITVAQVAQGLKQGLNVGLDFGILVGQTATLSNPDPVAGTFNMDQLREHNFPLEHDVSLSRQDYYQGDDLSFNQSVFNEVLSFYEGMETTSLPVAIHAQWARVQTQRNINGNKEIYGPRQVVLALVETSLYMSVMGNPLTGDAPISYVKSFFGRQFINARTVTANVVSEQERLPYELGWTPSALETNFATLAVMAGELLLVDPEQFGQGLPNITLDTIKDVYELKDPITGVLINATCAATGSC